MNRIKVVISLGNVIKVSIFGDWVFNIIKINIIVYVGKMISLL